MRRFEPADAPSPAATPAVQTGQPPMWALDDDDISSILLKGASEGVQNIPSPVLKEETMPEPEPLLEKQAQQAIADVQTEQFFEAGGPGFSPAELVEGQLQEAGGITLPADVDQTRRADAKQRTDELVALLSEGYWADAKALLLRPISKGGLRSSFSVSGDEITFKTDGGLIRSSQVSMDLSSGKLSCKARGTSDQEVAQAFVECGKAAGWKTMWFKGSPEFMQLVTALAKAEGIQVVSQSDIQRMQKAAQPTLLNSLISSATSILPRKPDDAVDKPCEIRPGADELGRIEPVLSDEPDLGFDR
ncbi:hypothetical protein [Pseudomonas sp. GXZC]|uniref:hypothetical protein n=1 Tax=Pseudomonas sp. GXZC TaxID=3003351 RepID=UPI0022AB3045|nr:hypothetical protein [Pseudomonas sp. GXZC]WAT32113.1 hypothetical protein OZ428_34190 [Pseudomonas sp. GXZC]